MKTLQEITDWINYHTDVEAKLFSDFVSIELEYDNSEFVPNETGHYIYINEPAEFEMLEQEILLGCDEIGYFDSPEHRLKDEEERMKKYRSDPLIDDSIPF